MAGEERRGKLSKPATLKPGHEVNTFDCGRAEITNWLKQWGKRAADADTARTFVVCRGTKRVVGYYCLSVGAVAHMIDESTGKRLPRTLRQNSTDPVPVIVLGRLGIDVTEQRQGLGSALVAEAMKRAAQASKIVGVRAMLVHALDDGLAEYYASLGFIRFNPTSKTLFILTKTIRDAI